MIGKLFFVPVAAMVLWTVPGCFLKPDIDEYHCYLNYDDDCRELAEKKVISILEAVATENDMTVYYHRDGGAYVDGVGRRSTIAFDPERRLLRMKFKGIIREAIDRVRTSVLDKLNDADIDYRIEHERYKGPIPIAFVPPERLCQSAFG